MGWFFHIIILVEFCIISDVCKYKSNFTFLFIFIFVFEASGAYGSIGGWASYYKLEGNGFDS